MHELSIESLRQSYGWEAVAGITLLHHGENRIFAVEADGRRHAIRLCRPDSDRAALRAEMAWLQALAPLVPVPRVVNTAAGDPVGTVALDGQRRMVVVFEFVDGSCPRGRDVDNYRRLGIVLRRLHTAADSVLAGHAPEWPGHRRRTYRAADLRAALDEALRSSDLADEALRSSFLRIADKATMLSFGPETMAGQFIHADLHLGNILALRDEWVCLDFEECGFGPRVLDLGVVRFHLAAEHADKEFWTAFLDGYGPNGWSDRDLRIGAVLRILYAASKIPSRLDVPELTGRALAVLRRYRDIAAALLGDP